MIDYETVLGATQGDALCCLRVLEHFEPLIDRLSTHAFEGDGERASYGLDQAMKTELQGRLLQAVLKFRV